jgi:hypothetical protein
VDQESQELETMKEFSLKSMCPESAAAVETFIRAIYGFPLPPAEELVWASWLDIVIYAPTHLSPDVSEEAEQKFIRSCLEQTDMDEVAKILQILDGQTNSVDAERVETIRKHHELKLLRNKSYRAWLSVFDNGRLWQHMDDLVDVAEKVRAAT